MQDGGATHPVQPVGERSRQVLEVVESAPALEQHDSEVLAEEAGMTGDLHGSAIVPDPARQREGAKVGGPAQPDLELVQFPVEFPEAGDPVGEGAVALLQRRVDFAYDGRVETHPGEKQKVAAQGPAVGGQQAGREPPRNPFSHLPDNVFRAPAETKLSGEHVARARGQDAERNRRMDHSIDGLIDSAVSARDQDQVGAPADTLARDCGRRPRPFGSNGRNVVPSRLEGLDRTVNPPDVPSLQTPRQRVVDEKSVAISGDKASAPRTPQL